MSALQAGEQIHQIEAVVFDKDGTLIDFHHLWSGKARATVAALIERYPEYPELGDALFRSLGYDPVGAITSADSPLAVSPMETLETVIAVVLYQTGVAWHPAQAAARETFGEFARALPRGDQLKPIGNLPGLFKRLKNVGIRIAVATSDDRAATRETLSLLGLTPWVDALFCGDDPLPAKPAPEGLHHLADQLGVPTTRMMMVGDSACDMQTGRNAGVACCVGVASGTADAEILIAEADVVLGTVHDLRLVP